MDLNTQEQFISVTKTETSKISQIDFDNLSFGKHTSDHMFIADYVDGEWTDLKIVPYGTIAMDPATSVLHYGQAIFEGMKAYKDTDGNPTLFRAIDNFKRFNKSAERMAMIEVPEEIFMNGLKQLVDLDSDWIPTTKDGSLYIRPFLFSTDAYIGVKASESYRFMIITCPAGSYYNHPVKVYTSDEYVRAIPGGVGFAKAAGNYAASMKPAIEARDSGYDQVMWLDGYDFKYIQEIGTMNVFFDIDGTIITPAINGAILEGITRDSVITILKDSGYNVIERELSIDEVIEAHKNGKLRDAFGSGTAASISQIATIGYKGNDYDLPSIESRKASNFLLQELNDIKYSRTNDKHGWVTKV